MPACRVEIRAPDTPQARAAAKRLTRVFESCGYISEIFTATDASRGIRLETVTKNAEAALAIQTAFHDAGIEILLTVHESAPHNSVILHLAPEGYG
jgi:hypothetical protein